MTREIMIPKSENYCVVIPKEYINKKVEILVLPFETPLKNASEAMEHNILSLTKSILPISINPIEWQKT